MYIKAVLCLLVALQHTSAIFSDDPWYETCDAIKEERCLTDPECYECLAWWDAPEDAFSECFGDHEAYWGYSDDSDTYGTTNTDAYTCGVSPAMLCCYISYTTRSTAWQTARTWNGVHVGCMRANMTVPKIVLVLPPGSALMAEGGRYLTTLTTTCTQRPLRPQRPQLPKSGRALTRRSLATTTRSATSASQVGLRWMVEVLHSPNAWKIKTTTIPVPERQQARAATSHCSPTTAWETSLSRNIWYASSTRAQPQ